MFICSSQNAEPGPRPRPGPRPASGSGSGCLFFQFYLVQFYFRMFGIVPSLIVEINNKKLFCVRNEEISGHHML